MGAMILIGVVASTPTGTEGRIGSALMILLPPVAVWLLAYRPRVVLDATTLTVVNPLRTTTVPLQCVDPLTRGGYSGIKIMWIDEGRMRSVEAWAIQKANVSGWLSRETRADRIGHAIATAALAARQQIAQ
jgi:hypothetical protein